MGRMKIRYDDDGEWISKRGESRLSEMDAAREAAQFESMSDDEYWRYRRDADRKVEMAKRQRGHNVQKSQVGSYPLDATMKSRVEDLKVQTYGAGDTAYEAFHKAVDDVAAMSRAEGIPGYEGLSSAAASAKLLEELEQDEIGRAAMNYAHSVGINTKLSDVSTAVRKSYNGGVPRDSEEAFAVVLSNLHDIIED